MNFLQTNTGRVIGALIHDHTHCELKIDLLANKIEKELSSGIIDETQIMEYINSLREENKKSRKIVDETYIKLKEMYT